MRTLETLNQNYRWTKKTAYTRTCCYCRRSRCRLPQRKRLRRLGWVQFIRRVQAPVPSARRSSPNYGHQTLLRCLPSPPMSLPPTHPPPTSLPPPHPSTPKLRHACERRTLLAVPRSGCLCYASTLTPRRLRCPWTLWLTVLLRAATPVAAMLVSRSHSTATLAPPGVLPHRCAAPTTTTTTATTAPTP